jgi:hypothetical protein
MTGLVPLWAVITVLVAAVIAANLPFVNERLFFVGPRQENKAFAWRLLELVVYAGLVGVLGRVLEGHLSQSGPVRWEFVSVWMCVFLTLAFPGFIWRYLRKP